MSQHQVSARMYLITLVALLTLTALTFALSFAPLGRLHVTIALTIALAKATFIALFFMHLAEQKPINRIVLMASVLLLAILIALTAADVATRHVPLRPPASG